MFWNVRRPAFGWLCSLTLHTHTHTYIQASRWLVLSSESRRLFLARSTSPGTKVSVISGNSSGNTVTRKRSDPITGGGVVYAAYDMRVVTIRDAMAAAKATVKMYVDCINGLPEVLDPLSVRSRFSNTRTDSKQHRWLNAPFEI